MSIRSELNNAKYYLRESRKAILGRGGEISEKAGLKDIPEAVWSIPADASLAFREDSDVAYEKVVPSGAEEYALVKSLGGMSYKALGNNNLCSGDKVYTLNGEETYDVVLATLDIGDYYLSFDRDLSGIGEMRLLGGNLSNQSDIYGESMIFNVWENRQEIILRIESDVYMGGTEYLNGTLKNFMICKADDADKTYKPYSPILVSAKPTSLESSGAQLIPFPYYEGGTGKVKNHNGITFTVRDDRGIHIKGKATADAYFILSKMDFGEKTISAILYEQATNNVYTISKRLFYNSSNKLTTVSITDTNKDFDEIIYPMVNRGATLAPYKPYSAEPIDTLEIPEAVQSLDGWRLGVNAEYNNHIVWRDGRVFYVQEVKSYAYNGTESLEQKIGSSIFYNLNLTDAKYAENVPCKCNLLEGALSGGASSYGVGYTWFQSVNTYTRHYMYISNDITTSEQARAYLKAQYDSGNPLTVVYALAEPIETDITHLFTDTSPFLKVQGGGSVIANNERKDAVPSTLKYTIKVGS